MTLTQIQALAHLNYKGFEGVMLNIDDGDASAFQAIQYAYGEGVVGTAYAITDFIDTGGYMTSANLQTIYSNGWDVGNHTTTNILLTTLSEADQETALDDAKTALDGWGLTRASNLVAYPSGAWNADTLTAMTNTGMLLGRIATGGVKTSDPLAICPHIHDLTYIVSSSSTVADVQSAINTARTRGKYVMILFHRFVVSSPGGNQWTYSQWETLIDWIVAQGIPNKTVSQFWAGRTS